jgi:hypothetical protein
MAQQALQGGADRGQVERGRAAAGARTDDRAGVQAPIRRRFGLLPRCGTECSRRDGRRIVDHEQADVVFARVYMCKGSAGRQVRREADRRWLRAYGFLVAVFCACHAAGRVWAERKLAADPEVDRLEHRWNTLLECCGLLWTSTDSAVSPDSRICREIAESAI